MRFCLSVCLSVVIIFITGQHRRTEIQCQITEVLKLQYQKEVEVWMKSFGETRCMNPQKPKTKIKMRNQRKYKEIYRMNCLIGYRNSGRIWLMKVLQHCLGAIQSREVKTLPSRLMNFQWEPRAKVEPGSGTHSVFTHFPEDPNCEICLKTKITRASCGRRTWYSRAQKWNIGVFWLLQITKFWVKKVNRRTIIDMPWSYKTWQHKGYSPTRAKQKPPRRPRRTKWSSCSQQGNQVVYTDNSLEFGKYCEELSWNHCTSTPHRSETNLIAERAVRRAKEGASAVLLQSGLGNEWWADSLECHSYLRNIQDLLSDGKTPYERRSGMPFHGPVIPFAASQSRLHQFEAKVLPGIFLGCALYAGWIRKRDIMDADIEELEEMDASELHGRRPNAKEVLTPQREWKQHHFPNRRWNSQNLWRRTASENIHFNPGSSRKRRRTRNSSRKVRRIRFSNPTSRRLDAWWWGSEKWLPEDHKRIQLSWSRWTQSQTVQSRKKKHFLFRWSTSTLPEQHIRHWT